MTEGTWSTKLERFTAWHFTENVRPSLDEQDWAMRRLLCWESGCFANGEGNLFSTVFTSQVNGMGSRRETKRKTIEKICISWWKREKGFRKAMGGRYMKLFVYQLLQFPTRFFYSSATLHCSERKLLCPNRQKRQINAFLIWGWKRNF